jgi:hypothetical protein
MSHCATMARNTGWCGDGGEPMLAKGSERLCDPHINGAAPVPYLQCFREFVVARQLQPTTAMQAPVVFPARPRRPTHEQIARLAYQLYLAGGRQSGLSVEDWLCAEYLLRPEPPTAWEPSEPQPNRTLMAGTIRLVSARKVPSVAASPAPVSVPLPSRRFGPMTAPA